MIDRQAALDALANNMPLLTTPDGCGLLDHDIYVADEAYVDCMQIIKELPSAQPGWIPCSKKLPEPNRSVLVQTSDDFVDPILIMTFNISKCEGDFFCSWRTQEMGIDFDMDDIVAWMPLPTPYQEGDEK